jgi:hypothetical protein
MSTIRSLKPNVSREEAVAKLCPGGLIGILRSFGRGPLRAIADVYVPFRLYRVEILNGERRQGQWLALDAARGSLDLYAFDRPPHPSEMVQLDTRNCLQAALGETRSREIVAEKVRRLIFLTGFFRIRNLSIHTEHVPLELYIPYWVGVLWPRRTCTRLGDRRGASPLRRCSSPGVIAEFVRELADDAHPFQTRVVQFLASSQPTGAE